MTAQHARIVIVDQLLSIEVSSVSGAKFDHVQGLAVVRYHRSWPLMHASDIL